MKKKIVMILTNSFFPDPRVYKEAQYLINHGFDVTILCWYREDDVVLPENENVDGINIVRFHIISKIGSGYKQILAYLKYIKACRNYLKLNPCDYIHANDLDGAIVACLARIRKCPFVFDMHEFYEDVGLGHELKRIMLRKATIFMIKKSKVAIRTNDLYLRKSYSSVQDKLILLKNLPDRSLIKCLPKTKSDKFRIGYHGAVRHQVPEFETLFESVKNLEDVRIDVYGTGPDLPALKEIAEKYDNVFIHGRFDGARQLSELYANTDVEFAGYRPNSDTREEQEVVKFFECILTGTPIILTNAYTKMKKEIETYNYGLTCDTRCVEEVRNCVLKMKNDSAFRKKCSEAEIKQSYRYDWTVAVKVLDAAYGEKN